MSATKLDITLRLDGREIFTTVEAPGAAQESERTVKAGNAINKSVALTGSTTPKVDKSPISKTLTMTGGTDQLDLTAVAGLALPATATRTIDVTGGKLVAWSAYAPASNAAAINMAPGASNPYPFLGTANDIDILPGQRVFGGFLEAATTHPAVSGTVKRIDFVGTAADVLYLDLYFGT